MGHCLAGDLQWCYKSVVSKDSEFGARTRGPSDLLWSLECIRGAVGVACEGKADRMRFKAQRCKSNKLPLGVLARKRSQKLQYP